MWDISKNIIKKINTSCFPSPRQSTVEGSLRSVFIYVCLHREYTKLESDTCAIFVFFSTHLEYLPTSLNISKSDLNKLIKRTHSNIRSTKLSHSTFSQRLMLEILLLVDTSNSKTLIFVRCCMIYKALLNSLPSYIYIPQKKSFKQYKSIYGEK